MQIWWRTQEILPQLKKQLKRLIPQSAKSPKPRWLKNGVLIFTADHGNAEELINLKTGAIDKEHSTNPVPFLLVGKQFEGQNLGFPESLNGDLSLVAPIGILADVAPTILKIMELNQPKDMSGAPL